MVKLFTLLLVPALLVGCHSRKAWIKKSTGDNCEACTTVAGDEVSASQASVRKTCPSYGDYADQHRTITRVRKTVHEEKPKLALTLDWIPLKLPVPRLCSVPGPKTVTIETETIPVCSDSPSLHKTIPNHVQPKPQRVKPSSPERIPPPGGLVVTPRLAIRPELSQKPKQSTPRLAHSPWPPPLVPTDKAGKSLTEKKHQHRVIKPVEIPEMPVPEIHITSVTAASETQTEPAPQRPPTLERQEQELKGLMERLHNVQKMCEEAEKHLLPKK